MLRESAQRVRGERHFADPVLSDASHGQFQIEDPLTGRIVERGIRDADQVGRKRRIALSGGGQLPGVRFLRAGKVEDIEGGAR